MIVFDQVTKTFPNGDTVLDKVSFHVKPGEMMIITGASGAGKTTIGRLIIREIVPTSGSISIDGENILEIKPKNLPALRRKIGTVFQDYKIIPDKTIYENIAINLQVAGFPEDQIPSKINHLLNTVGIANKEHLFPVQLSGGELQRASLARAISVEPHILFADEPTGNLDKKTSQEIFDLLNKINQTGTTVIIATHDEYFVNKNTHHHVQLDHGKVIYNSRQEKTKNKSKEPAKPSKKKKSKSKDQP